jgi:amidohydrolase
MENEQLLEIRRKIHAKPELSFQEKETVALAEKYLKEFGFTVKGQIADTGLYADFGLNPRVAIRCEMDALPMAELNSLPYASAVPNVCHGCGHDAHVACVLGAAQVLSQSKESRLRIIMQPGEETADEQGRSGAEHVVDSGALSGITTVLGIHVDPTLPTGSVAILPIAAERRFGFSVEIKGSDMIAGLPEVLLSISGQPSVRLDELTADGARLKLKGNVISDESTDREVLKNSIAACFSQHDHTIDWHGDKNNGGSSLAVDAVLEAAATAIGKQNVQLSKRKTWSASLTEYARHASAILILLGSELRGDRRSQHTGRFDIDEKCLAVGASVLAEIVKQCYSE